MSRKGNCLGSAVSENFFGLLKNEMYNGQRIKDDELIEKFEEYIKYYKTQRIKVKLKGLAPIGCRHLSLQTALIKVRLNRITSISYGFLL